LKAVDRQELLGLDAYEQVREHFRRRIIELKRNRRVALGPNMTVLFENHDTVLFQVQEMLRTERITQESAISYELSTYNVLTPSEAELSASIFLEYVDAGERERMLTALAGVEQCFYLKVDGRRLPALGERRGDRTDRTTAVQYVRFPFDETAARLLRQGTGSVAVGVDHPSYHAEAELASNVRASLGEDFS
jgi:hypothetical protein